MYHIGLQLLSMLVIYNQDAFDLGHLNVKGFHTLQSVVSGVNLDKKKCVPHFY